MSKIVLIEKRENHIKKPVESTKIRASIGLLAVFHPKRQETQRTIVPMVMKQKRRNHKKKVRWRKTWL